ncbi:MAG: serine hydrolase [Pseudomonadota bacterium]
MASTERWLAAFGLATLSSIQLACAAAADTTAAADSAAAAEAPAVEVAEPGEILFLRGNAQVDAFRRQQELAATRRIAAGEATLPLPPAAEELDGASLAIDLDGERLSLDAFLEADRYAGFLVLKDGAVVYEGYGFGNSAATRWISFSVAKSVVAMLTGAAIADGYITSVDDPVVDYLPKLRNSGYEGATVKDLLQMASGVAWNEDYADPQSDVASANYATLPLYEHLRAKERVAPPGERFNYNSAETNLAGTLVRSAIGNNLSTYLSEKIWKPYGMGADAFWNLTEPGGGEFGGCCINATLRDYARLGLFALGDGVLADGTRVLPEGWMAASRTTSTGYSEYGYFWWLNDESPAFSALGIFGQTIYINPESGVVIATHGAWNSADGDDYNHRRDIAIAAIEGRLAVQAAGG